MKNEEVLKGKLVLSQGNDTDELRIIDPIKDLDLGDTAYKVEQSPMEDTEKKLKGLNLNYYTIRGGEVQSKQFNDDKDAVVFNKGLADEFEIPVAGRRGHQFDAMDTWYAEKKQALALAKHSTQVELKNAAKFKEQWQEAVSFLENQIENNMF